MRMQMTCLLAVVLGMGLCGCGSGHGGSLSMKAIEGGKSFSEDLGNAFFDVSKEGDFDIVLMDKASAWQFDEPTREGALKPIRLTPVRQVFVIHSNWKHKPGTKRSPASANASLTWYVLGDKGPNDLIVYQGIAHVVIEGDPGDREVTVVIREGSLEPTLISGDMSDPMGKVRLTGSCDAVRRSAQVQDLLSDMESRRKAAAQAGAAAH